MHLTYRPARQLCKVHCSRIYANIILNATLARATMRSEARLGLGACGCVRGVIAAHGVNERLHQAPRVLAGTCRRRGHRQVQRRRALVRTARAATAQRHRGPRLARYVCQKAAVCARRSASRRVAPGPCKANMLALQSFAAYHSFRQGPTRRADCGNWFQPLQHNSLFDQEEK